MVQEPRMFALSFGLGTLQQVACAQFQPNLLLSESIVGVVGNLKWVWLMLMQENRAKLTGVNTGYPRRKHKASINPIKDS